jgi:integrase
VDSDPGRDSHLPAVQVCRLGDAADDAPGHAQQGEDVMSEAKRRKRARGDGSLGLRGRVWWISYKHPDGRRVRESAHTDRRAVAERLLRKRIGGRENNLAVIPNAEQLTFHDAAKMVTDDANANGRKSAQTERRLRKYLEPFFGRRRMIGITTSDVTAFIAHRKAEGIIAVRGPHKGERVGDVSNAEVNRELQVLKRMFSLAIRSGRLAMKPHITMLKESAPRSGFFEREQYESVLRHLPDDLRPVITFAYVTGWRLASEILPLEWRQVDFDAEMVRLIPGTTKNKEGREFPFTDELRVLLKAQQKAHAKLKKAGHITPLVFWRMVADERGGEKKPRPITSLTKAWKNACKDAGCPGRIPHDLRRTAIRNLVRVGVSESVAMKLSGHKTRSVFDRYDITSTADLRDAARKLDLSSTGTNTR